MSAEAYRDEEMYREAEPNLISVKRNPYLVDYEQQRRLREHRGQRMLQSAQGMGRVSRRMSQEEQEMRGASRRIPRGEQETGRAPQRAPQQRQEMGRVSRRMSQGEQEMRGVSRRMPQGEREMRRAPRRTPQQSQEMNRRAAIEKRRAAAHRRRIVRMQRMVLFSGMFCIALLCGILLLKRTDAKTVQPDNQISQPKVTDDTLPVASSGGLIQGLPAAEFAKHPEWEENFLTPNEYSRPGEALEEVNSIFVHYTANPKTSAAQNRSYFEQLKDTHITSASAHFIIGYNGEIVQCIPLDEIAYAVQTRNYDSISIECCYKSADGSFTQETYDSLIELLAWLTDAYDLTTDDILRHYDCGGKKCPIYYTEHEDAWLRLKEDVSEK